MLKMDTYEDFWTPAGLTGGVLTTKSGPDNYPEMSKQITKDKTISKRKSKKVDSEQRC